MHVANLFRPAGPVWPALAPFGAELSASVGSTIRGWVELAQMVGLEYAFFFGTLRGKRGKRILYG